MLAFHAILGAYGFWLPNDPRGSWSSFVGSWNLYRYGPATKVHTRQSVAAQPHDEARRLQAKQALKFPPVQFTGQQANTIARGFALAARTYPYRVLACAILPDHVHLVIVATDKPTSTVVGHFKRKANDALLNNSLHPLAPFADPHGHVPSCWARNAWEVFLDTPHDVRRAIAYVNANPIKEGKRPQHWRFVEPWND